MKSKKPTTLSEFTPELMEKVREILSSHDYEMLERIGRGGFSVIFKVMSRKYNNYFAAKVTNMESKRHRTSDKTAQIEQNALSHLNHPNVIKLYESFNENGIAFLILELCTGDTLRNKIVSNRSGPIPYVVEYMKQLAMALYYCHSEGFVHRDIKPANVLFDQYSRPVLADFGMCIPVPMGTQVSDYVGSPQYIAPEIINQRSFDPYKTDIWALGVTFYEMASGMIKWPKDKELIKATIADGGIIIKPGLPRRMTNLISAMTDMNPERRPTMEQIINCKMFKDPASPDSKINPIINPTPARISSVHSKRKPPIFPKGLSRAQRSIIYDQNKYLNLRGNRQQTFPNLTTLSETPSV